jgi:tRNA (cmo5U34)-methyltransferase
MTATLWSEDDSTSFIRHAEHFVPDRADQLAVVSTMIGDPGRGLVLDLCNGAGGLSGQLLADHPGCRVIGLDTSPAMLEESTGALARFGARYSTERFDLGSADWRRREQAPAAVVSSLAVHHLDGEQKQQLFRDVHAMLAPGGSLVIADLIAPVGRRSTELASRTWDEWVREHARASGAGDQAYQAFHALEWNWMQYPDELDKPSSLAEQLTWLGQAGFTDVDAYWVKAGHAVFGGTKKGNENDD